MIIAPRFCGPKESANGGYAAGLLAKPLGHSVEVTLRRPPPLGRELHLHLSDERAEFRDGPQLVAEARRAGVEVQPPPAPSYERAVELSHHYVGHTRHHFPSCFVCGPARATNDGLRIFPGAERDGDPVAAPWVPGPSLADAEGRVSSEFVWAALDCVGYFAVARPDYPVALLGRMAAKLSGELLPNERCVVLGWSVAREGRKLHAGTAVFGADGKLRGRARQTWILLA